MIRNMFRSRLLSLALLLFALNAHAALLITAQRSRFAGADGTVPLTFSITATGDAQDLQVVYPDFSQTVTMVPSTEWNCSKKNTLTTCNFAHVLGADGVAQIEFRVRFDQPYGRGGLGVSATANVDGKSERAFASGVAVLYRRFIVTQPGDAGDGSVRAMVEALNADPLCASVPCSIDFDIPSADGAATIALQSALPQITGRDVLVDGSTQSGTIGRITLDGAAVAGNALDFNVGERAEVYGLTIASFGDNAVLLRQRRTETRQLTVSHCTIEHNLRGINFTPGYLGTALISDNTLRDNVRSAVFDGSDHNPGVPLQPPMRIENNVITGNGASGIFLGNGSDGALITGNRIEANRDFGIGVGPGAINVRIVGNSIAHNGNLAIDIGLDGPTLLLSQPTGDRSAAVIGTATYDPVTNTTTITGPKPSVVPIGICDLCITHIVSLYANDAAEHGEYAEAQTYLGDAQPNGAGFVLTVKGNLRGKFITALSTRWVNGVGSDLYNTGELSKAFQVR
jgi:parallel beta-helix repeat protein